MKAVYKEAIAKWGKAHQVDVAISEMAELTQALCNERREERCSLPSIIRDEIADVYIVLEQLKLLYFDDDRQFKDSLERKTLKLARHIKEKENK